GAFSMRAGVRDRESEIDVETLILRTGTEDDATLLLEGSMDDIFSRDLINFSLMFEAATRPWVEKLYGHKVPEDHRVKGRTSFTGSRRKYHFEGTAHSGKTHIVAEVDASRVNERWSIAANISAPKIYLDDLGFYPKVPEGVVPVQKDKKNRREKIFSDIPYPFPELKEVDLSFRLDTEEVIGRGFILNDFDIDVALKDGLMLLGPLRMTYADGFVLLESSINVRGSIPEVKLSLKAEDIDIGDVLAYVHSPMILGGHLNLSADFQSSGVSPHELASALKGELGIAIEHGKIKQISDLLGADAIDFITTARKMGTYAELNCMALNIKFIEGIGNTQIIYVDTPSVRSTGKGTVNLREESIDLVIQPKPKKGLLGGSSPVTINGPLSSPSTRKLPFIEATRLYGEIFMPYAFLPARLIGYVWFLMGDDKDEASPCLNPEFQERKE
ncbi:MAG: AsmA-like C-terminal region-containing protein, partial [Nitrospiraceae bacterium]